MSHHDSLVAVGLTDHLPEDIQAMLLAQYSRNFGPIEDRIPSAGDAVDLERLRASLRRYYLGYGHKSVGQLGGTTTFCEGVSQIAAKALEDTPLFNGQESSTRYIDYSNQPMVHFDDPFIQLIQEELRTLYIVALNKITDRIRADYPYSGEAGDTKALNTWDNTCRARAFDICRAFLPAGVTTNVGFKATFDVHNDHFGALLQHPSPEISSLAERVLVDGAARYPDAFESVDKLKQRNAYRQSEHFYHESLRSAGAYKTEFGFKEQSVDDLIQKLRQAAEHESVGVENSLIRPEQSRELFLRLMGRKKWEQLPPAISSAVRFRITDKLDFGSFRDWQRHRNGVCVMPLLTPYYGIHPWYLQEIGEEFAQRLNDVMQRLCEAFARAELDGNQSYQVLLQYAVPMGAMVKVDYVCDLNQLLYLIELRSGLTVHQTLRLSMISCYYRFYECLGMQQSDGEKLMVFPDLTMDNFTLKRGTQTFAGEFKLEQ